MAQGEHDSHLGPASSGDEARDLPGIDTSVLAGPDLEVADLYRDLARVRAQEWVEVLLPHYCLDPAGADAFAQGLDCLIETVAHLEAAADLLGDGSARETRLRSLSAWLLVEAAAFGHTADVLAAGQT